jgi:D-alanine-D-alanine ligase
LLGGPSAEREISLLSGNAVVGALRSKGVDAYPFDPAERELFDLKREGSTIGITKVTSVDHDELRIAYEGASRHDRLVLVEEFVSGVELTASIVNGRALPLIRIEAPQGNYDYHNKYFSDETKYFCPSGIPERLEQAIRRQSLAAFDVVGCSGWGRLDLILRDDESYSFLEVNTSPGMTGHSLVPMAARQAGTSFADLCIEILEGAHVG